ncbi:hypothetical protein ACEWY4_000078 [Coilia grayii]|uniref:RNA helicase n=1 Tax=Coilia grayii TaxID=363190 RepID=A0ABD1KVL9_9TELE
MAASLKKAAHEIESRKRTDDVLLSENIEFSSLLLSEPVLKGLTSAGFQKPSPIQLKAIPLGRCGLDLIVQAKSGTGKTCVFATVALDALIPENTGTQVLVLAPTREIAVQIHAVVMAIGSAVEGLECHVFIGGTPVSQDKTHLKKCHIAVGSPGRIKQLIEMGLLTTASIRLFVLDEADKLMEEGSFQEQINWIFSSLPVNKQMLALSATYPEFLAQQLTHYMRDPTFVRLNPSDPGLIGLRQYYRLVASHALVHKVFEEKVHQLLQLYSRVPFNQSLVFSNLHSRAQQLADILCSKGLPAVCISSSLTQDQRLDAMSKLKRYQCRVLISTDLTSRGIDAEKVNLVVNLDVPQDWETYMHRIGRAGRFGTHGVAVTYCCHGEEENKMMMIAQKCSLNIAPLPDPIPADLMEERCDWDITVQPPLKDDLSTLSLPRKKSPPTHTNQEPSGHVTVEQESHRPIVKQHTNRAQKPRKAPPRLSEPQGGGAAPPSRRQLQDALPKIPPLPSFKPRGVGPISLQAAMLDFQHFMAEGPGRSVEVVRQFRGRDDDDVTSNGGAELREESIILQDESRPSTSSLTMRKMTSDPSSSTSSSPRSSSPSSESDTDEQQQRAAMPSPRKVASQATPPHVPPQTVPRHRSQSQQRAAKPPAESPQPSVTPPRRTQARRPAPPAKRGGGTWGRGRSLEPQEAAGEGERAGQDCWGRSYYQAWRQYYSSLPPSYWQAYSPAHSPAQAWMAAYRMSSVYIQEMMKD